MFREAIILAGGFGTRLSHVVSNVPKPMAPVYGKPFLSYVLDRLVSAGIERVILATGYKHEVINNWFGTTYRGIEILYSHEDKPLFTGGAIKQAVGLLKSEDFIVLNGDTLFDVDFNQLYDFHVGHKASLSIALRHVEDTGRYGSVQCDNNRIVAFQEKADSQGPGDINGGIYAIHRKWFEQQELPESFSFEKELMQPLAGQARFYGLSFSDYFIDIGIPEDYWRAQREFAGLFEKDAFLFLDRDGVLNKHLVGDYVRNWGMWEWLPNVLDTLAILTKRFRRIVLVSNQQGVGKGLMTEEDLEDIHQRMMDDIQKAGGRIDGIYTCTEKEDAHSPNRKPAIGMALQAQHDFSEIDFHRSVMVGDNVTDMLFARNAQMRAVYVTKNNPIPDEVRDITDLFVADLSEFARPYFSILLPTYKSRFLKESIDSVLSQTYDNWELIIVNDASPEDIDGIVEIYHDPRIRYYKNAQNFGAKRLVEQWNYCLSLAKGEYVLCIGDDDRLMPNCLSTYAQVIQKYPDVSVVHGQTDIIDGEGKFVQHTAPRPLWESAMSLLYNRTNTIYDHQFIGDFCYKKKDLLDKGGYFYIPYAWGSDDISALMAAEKNGIANTQDVVFLYRDNNASISRTPHTLGKIKAIIREALWKRKFLSKPHTDQDDEKYRHLLRRGLMRRTLQKCYYILYDFLHQ